MCMVALPDRLASASAVFFGRHGDVTRHARQRGVSRQRLYREAASVLRDLRPRPSEHLEYLRQQLSDLQSRLQTLQTLHLFAVVLGADKQAEFAATAQAEGVSLPTTRRLLGVLLGENTFTVSIMSVDRSDEVASVYAAASGIVGPPRSV
jgi:hypothetical protein